MKPDHRVYKPAYGAYSDNFITPDVFYRGTARRRTAGNIAAWRPLTPAALQC